MKIQDVKKVAVIQLDGRKELLLSLPAINGLKKLYPKAQFTLFTSTECNELIRLLNDVEEVVLVDIQHLSQSNPGPQGLFDLSVNLSFSDAGIVYSSLITSYRNLGTGIDEDKNPRFLSPWAIYHESTIAEATLNPFHRSDIYKAIAEVSRENCEHSLSVTDALAQEAQKYLCADEHLKIAVSLASISLEEVQAMALTVARYLPNTRLYFLGTLKDKARANEVLESLGEASKYCVDLCGKLSIDVTAAFTRAVDALIGSDDELNHIASAYGTFTISIGNRRNQTTDSCVYNHGHLVINRHEDSSCGALLGEILQYAAKGNEGSVPTAEQWQIFCDNLFDAHAHTAQIYITQRISCRENEPNYSETSLLPLMYLGAEYADCIRAFYKLLWHHELNQRNETIYGLDVFHQNAQEQLPKILKPLEQLYELSVFGQKYCSIIKKDLIEKNYEKAKANSAKLQDVDALIDLMADSYQDLTPIINFFQVSQSQIRSKEPIAVAVETTKLYLSLQHQVLILLELCEAVFQRIRGVNDGAETVDGGA